jgi:hypothetical protein
MKKIFLIIAAMAIALAAGGIIYGSDADDELKNTGADPISGLYPAVGA